MQVIKKVIGAAAVSTLLVLPACQMGAQPDDIYEESGDTINVGDRNELNNRNQDSDQFGYVRYQKSDVANDRTNRNNDAMYIDREGLADAISRMGRQLPEVDDIATLVTDEEVLVAYDTESADRNQTADMVKKTAISVVPRYYHVYVSDNPNMINQIERFGNNGSNNRDIEQIIDRTIAEMKKSPQGKKLSDGENENGEMSGEMNGEYEDRGMNR
ncbi:YhcN/YlaJ family sporulation lipoprotein [Bacillus marinisedimentorum]|uniref:YhcN/YlaJ family sporulation lipoprotein n=1 Tax=Bacillus marinisedimentorum TaxID=1821260 RepID=UPI003CCB77F2